MDQDVCFVENILQFTYIIFQFIEESAFLEFGENLGILFDSIIKQLVYNIMTSSKSKLIFFLLLNNSIACGHCDICMCWWIA